MGAGGGGPGAVVGRGVAAVGAEVCRHWTSALREMDGTVL